MRVKVTGPWDNGDGRRARAEDRRPVQVPARLRWGGGERHAQLLDVSPSGFRARAADGPPVGTRVEVELPAGDTRRAQVRWRLGDACGGRWEQPLDSELLDEADHRPVLPTPYN